MAEPGVSKDSSNGKDFQHNLSLRSNSSLYHMGNQSECGGLDRDGEEGHLLVQQEETLPSRTGL